MKNGLIKNITTDIFEIRKYAFLNSSKMVWAEKSSLVFWDSKSFFYKYLKQSKKEKHCSRYFEIAKYAFLNIWKRVWGKNLSQVFSDSSVCFLRYLKKAMSKRIVASIFKNRKYAFWSIQKSVRKKELSFPLFKLVRMLF